MLKSYDSGRKEQKRGHVVRDMYILHDNAKPHVHINVRNFLESKGLKEIDLPPYSPDSNLVIFKERLDDEESQETLATSYTNILSSTPVTDTVKHSKDILKDWNFAC